MPVCPSMPAAPLTILCQPMLVAPPVMVHLPTQQNRPTLGRRSVLLGPLILIDSHITLIPETLVDSSAVLDKDMGMACLEHEELIMVCLLYASTFSMLIMGVTSCISRQ